MKNYTIENTTGVNIVIGTSTFLPGVPQDLVSVDLSSTTFYPLYYADVASGDLLVKLNTVPIIGAVSVMTDLFGINDTDIPSDSDKFLNEDWFPPTISITGPTGYDPAFAITVTLDSDPPDDWSPPGFSGSTQAIQIEGNGTNVYINSVDRSGFTDGQSLIFVNGKTGNGKVIFVNEGSGLATNIFRGPLGDTDLVPGPNISAVSTNLPEIDSWSMQLAKP